MNYFRRFRDAAICVVLLALPFFVLRANLRDPSKTTGVDATVLQLSAPFQYAATQLALGVSSIIQEYVYLIEVKRDNDRLREENALLRETAFKLSAQGEENHRLRRLLTLREQLGGTTLSAQVISKEVRSYFRVIRLRLDRGERDRVKDGMPVITADGLVGQIRRTSGRYSDVLLVADKTSAIDVVVQRTGARGMLKGTGSEEHYACRLEYLSREDDVQEGDLVVTSGLGQRFPASILVGKIHKVTKKESGLYQEAMVTPAVNFSHLEEVLVMTAGSRAQGIDEDEKMIASALTIGLGLLLLVAQSAVATLIPMHDFTPNVVLPLVVFMGVASEVQLVRGALTAFALGYLLDAFCGSSMGLHTFVMVAAFFASRGAGLRLFPQAALLQVMAMFVAAASADATVYALRGIFEQPLLPGLGEDLRATLMAVAASALATAVLSPVIVVMARRIEATRHRREERAVIGRAHL